MILKRFECLTFDRLVCRDVSHARDETPGYLLHWMVVTHLLLNKPLNHLGKYWIISPTYMLKAIVIIRTQWDSKFWWTVESEFIGLIINGQSDTKVTIFRMAILEAFFNCLCTGYESPSTHTYTSRHCFPPVVCGTQLKNQWTLEDLLIIAGIFACLYNK